ncbi:MAG: shikimate dehydrogenase [Candidatus Thermoplasmatota archaeon]
MTLIVVTATGDTPDELLARAKDAATVADVVEVRLDGPSGLPWDMRPFFTLGKPTLATVRVTEDGGRSAADDETRGEALRRAVRAGASIIDVESWHPQARALVLDAHAMGARAIVSTHDLQGTPDATTLVKMLREARSLGADIAKIATRVNGPADAQALVSASRMARDEGLPFTLMAVNDPFLRLLAPALGMALAYGSVPGAPPVVSGQVDARVLRETHRGLVEGMTGTTRLAFIFGHPVAHSKSPAMQNAAFLAVGMDARLVALDLLPGGLAAALTMLRSSNALGANVTLPHKEAALLLMDDVDHSARRAGAVNTIVVRDGRLVGHNTDGAGALDALHEAGVQPKRALVLGAGGAGRAIAAALVDAGAEVVLSNRTPERADRVAREVGARAIPWSGVPAMLHRVDTFVNATSIGLHGEELPMPLPANGLVVLDAVYGATPLTRRARAIALKVIPGEAMLLHQGARAFRLWTGREAPVASMRSALEAIS